MNPPGNERKPHLFHIVTFGCQMNLHDSEHIAGILEHLGYSRTFVPHNAGLVIFNTCCVRKSAENKVWGNISRFTSSKIGGLPLICVCGCMAQMYGTHIFVKSPGVDLVFGLGALERIGELITAARKRKICDLGDIDMQQVDRFPFSPEKSFKAWVPVSHGCGNFCSYCVVPYVRGRERSRSLAEIREEIKKLASSGAIEVVLLGHNVNSYGRDLEGDVDFAVVLREAARIPGIQRVRFETSHPKDISTDMLRAMSEEKAVCEHLHLPVQSGSNRILERMNRGYTREQFLETISIARETVPGISITTDIIVGFPGEKQTDFAKTLSLVKEARFDAAYMFVYSPRPKTSALQYKDDVPEQEKKRRLIELSRVQARITSEKMRSLVGSDLEVLIEGKASRGKYLTGRTRGNHVVLLPDEGLMPGMIVNARITDSGMHSLRGEAIEILYNPLRDGPISGKEERDGSFPR